MRSQAKEVFSRYTRPNDLATFENHDHVKSGKCFVAVSTTTGSPVASVKYVWDAFEGKEYARYVWANPNGLPYQDVKPMQCKVIDKDGQVQRCQSSGEFDALVNASMTE